MKALLIFVAFTASTINAQTADGFAFRVHVVNSVTGTAIAGANVVIDSLSGGQVWGRTDRGGIFTGLCQASGKQVLTVTRKGYRLTGGGGLGTFIEIRPGGENTAEVQMLPLGVIAGRVLDQFGDPVRHAIVRELRKVEEPGSEAMYSGMNSAGTDDRGEYRIVNVEPGSHYLAAEFSSQQAGVRPPHSAWPEMGGMVLLPDVTDIARAQQVEVSAGVTTRVNDLHLKVQRDVEISGRIQGADEQSVADLSLHKAGAGIGLNLFAVHGARSESDGSFTFHVLPAMYVLTASDPKTGKVSKITIDAQDRDVTNLVVTLDSKYEISGRIHIDGPEVLDFSKLRLNFLGGPVKIGSDGSFQANLAGDQAMFMLQGLPENWFSKDVTVGGQQLKSRLFKVPPGNTEMSITLSARGASVEATLPAGASMLDAALVVLLPEHGPIPDPESMIQARPNQTGKYEAHGVPPGTYRVFALDVNNFAYAFNPRLLMEKFGKLAPLLNVAEGEHKSIVVPLTKIPPG